MTKAELAQLIDAYADSKASGNKYLVAKMIEELEQALNQVCGEQKEDGEGLEMAAGDESY